MRSTWILLAASSLLLAACGGGSSAAAPEPPPADPLVLGTQVPTSATLSADGAQRFVASVAATASEAAEPLELGETQLASSETSEPSD